MTTISKVLAVFTSVASIAFMAFALVLHIGGPNWEAEAMSKDLKQDYIFTKTVGEESTTWAVTTRFGANDSIDNTPSLPQAVMKARQHLLAAQNARSSEIDTELTEIRAKNGELTAGNKEDLEALNRHEQKLITIANEQEQRITTASNEWTTLSRDTESIRREVRKRGEDVVRLRNELNELNTDKFRLQVLREDLADELVQLKLNNRALAHRNQQLKQTVSADGDDTAVPPPSEPGVTPASGD